ncbi:DUF4291 domain-containing protein [Chitinophaga barathri]|uniref:DUF4291 domain-containing protein n=1 Tax=Chitinophaga barathri TaxID=1647451 RepID=A0A3N4ML13_9BACT|nr:DUF4291 domain-containing protein [Chitinophaga barathri]RPD42647.1 DUF4291 domain-containing protein [Chitinophaga barathri]
MKKRIIRALWNEETITVYQAYNPAIANSAVKNKTFVSPPFKKERMTWIKPSFLWMMYRAGWGTKENQERILSIQIKREGFEWALQNSCLSHYDPVFDASHEGWKTRLHNSLVRVQWDPEKDIHLQNLPYRSIQIGLSGIAVEKYVNEWITGIEDITDQCTVIRQLVEKKQIGEAKALLPVETVYPLPTEIGMMLQADDPGEAN